MDVLTLLMFVGIVMVTLALGFFRWTVRIGSLQHADRLALLPLAHDEESKPATEENARLIERSRA